MGATPMSDKDKAARPTLKSVSAKNILSFGPDGMELELRPLNVLIGANGSGKSNLLELLNLLRAAPTDLSAPTRTGNGASDWIWRGDPDGTASVEAVIENPVGNQPLRHAIEFRESDGQFALTKERVEYADRSVEHERAPFFYKYRDGRASINLAGAPSAKKAWDNLSADKSILSERKDPDAYPEFSRLSEFYAGVRLYRDWDFGPASYVRLPQDARHHQSQMAQMAQLGERFHNLSAVLDRLRRSPETKDLLIEKLGVVYRGLTDFELDFKNGSVQISFTEGDFSIPASRISDGGFRYLALLAILLDPEPPPLIAIEEPELGLHFDLMPRMSDMLVDASSRSQIIVTTHSEVLVDALSDRPESVVVCQKRKGQGSMRRLERERMAKWLRRHTLGELWSMGQLGGVRW